MSRLFLALALVACACGDAPDPVSPGPAPVGITVSNAPILRTGQTFQLTATATFAGGASQNVTTMAAWRSSEPAVATVTNSGLVAAVGTGVSTVTAVYQGATGSVIVNVFVSPPPMGP